MKLSHFRDICKRGLCRRVPCRQRPKPRAKRLCWDSGDGIVGDRHGHQYGDRRSSSVVGAGPMWRAVTPDGSKVYVSRRRTGNEFCGDRHGNQHGDRVRSLRHHWAVMPWRSRRTAARSMSPSSRQGVGDRHGDQHGDRPPIPVGGPRRRGGHPGRQQGLRHERAATRSR